MLVFFGCCCELRVDFELLLFEGAEYHGGFYLDRMETWVASAVYFWFIMSVR